MDTGSKPPHPRSDTPLRYLGRHRLPRLSRTVFAAIATATVIGAGITAVSSPAPHSPASPITANAGLDARADRFQHRDGSADAPAAPTPAPPNAPKPQTSDSPDSAPSATETKKPDWVAPSSAPISDNFGPRGWRGGEMHYGADWAAAPGQLNYAIADAVVMQAGPNGAYGNSVILDHGNGIISVYGHHSEVLVAAGDTVQAGDPVGKAGATGDATGPHLHLEIHIDTVAVDPIEFLEEHGVDI